MENKEQKLGPKQVKDKGDYTMAFLLIPAAVGLIWGMAGLFFGIIIGAILVIFYQLTKI